MNNSQRDCFHSVEADMVEDIIWVHDKALKNDTLQGLDDQTKVIFIWDDHCFQNRTYSLKRLVFIYETLCQMPVEIIRGDTFEVMCSLAPKKVRTFFTADTKIKELTRQLSEDYDIEVINLQP
jgi:hypothetical protein